MACRAPRSNLSQASYYKDISEDESIFDLIDEPERLRSQDETIVDFELNYLDNITLGDGAIDYDDSVGAMDGDSGNSDIVVGCGDPVGAMVGDSGNGDVALVVGIRSVRWLENRGIVILRLVMGMRSVRWLEIRRMMI